MITKPSIQDLIAGLTANLEQAAGRSEGIDDALVVPLLTVLDRVANEWSSWSSLVLADNDDIRQTLTRLGARLPPDGEIPGSLADKSSAQAVELAEAENRRLKNALVETLDALDLPAEQGASSERQEADRAILELLQRMLRREAQVAVAPSRVAATSGNPSSTGLSLNALSDVLQRFLTREMPDAESIAIEQLQRLAGGASREAWIFDVRWIEQGEVRLEPCILMREPLASVLVSDTSAERIDGTRRTVANEIRVIRAMRAAGLPVPDILWADPDGEWLERPFSIARRLPGTADVNPVLETESAATLLDQFVEILGRIHALDPSDAGVDFLGTPTRRTAAIEQVEQFEGNFDAQRLEAFPATTYLIRWLKKNQPLAGRVCVIHGDYRLGNFLYEDDGIVAVLDWEQVHVGDPIEEIAFMYWSVWSLQPVCPIDEFVRRYEAKTGTTVDRDALAYYRVFIEFKMLVVLLTGLRSYFATPERQLHYGGAQAHQMIRDAQLRVIEELLRGHPTVEFDAYRPEV